MKKSGYFSAAALVAAAALFCGCRSETIAAPKGATISISATPASISVRTGVAVLSVKVLKDGVPVRVGTTVRLSSNLGNVTPEVVETDSSGYAASKLFAGDAAGTAKVTASSGGAEDADATVAITNAQTVRVTVDNPSPPRVSASGGSAILTARVTTLDGAASIPGVSVHFAGDTNVSIDQAFVTSDSNGIAKAQASAVSRSGTATITASADNATPASATLELVDSPGSASFGADPSSFSAQNADQTITLSVTVRGKVPPTSDGLSGVTVEFKGDQTLDYGAFENGARTGAKVTASDGKATIVFKLTASEQSQVKAAGGRLTISATPSKGFDNSQLAPVTVQIVVN